MKAVLQRVTRASVTVDGGDGDDNISNWESDDNPKNVSINSGIGNDSIENDGNNSTLEGGSGNDDVKNYGDSVTIYGSSGDDWIENYGGANVTINGGSGNDSLYNEYWTGSISGTNEFTTILPDNALIEGGDGYDHISNDGANVTINAGEDDN